MTSAAICRLMSLAAIALLIACGTEATAPAPPALQLAADEPPQFSDWSAPVNLGPVVNSASADIEVAISKDGRSLYFASNRPGGFGRQDIWVSQRASVEDPWGPPQNLGADINTAFDDRTPMITTDGHWMYFSSDRPAGLGGTDIYVSQRRDKRDDLAWQAPENLGSGVNTSFNENLPFYFDDDATGAVLYFNSNRPAGAPGTGMTDIYASPREPDESFGPAVLVPELNSPLRDAGMAIRRDGLELILASDRPGTFGVFDLWVSTRASTSDPWSTPVNLGSTVNSAAGEARLSLSFDGTTLYISGDRAGGVGVQDLWVSTRSRLRDHDEVVFAPRVSPVDAEDPPQFSDWSAPVNLGPIVNTAFVDSDPFISKDGLSLYFTAGRGRAPNFGLQDIWVSQRASVDDPWGPPRNLGATINTAAQENGPTLSRDEHRLYFASTRAGGLGSTDLYVSRRRDKRDDFGWEPPVNLGSGVNSDADDTRPVEFEDDASGTILLYFGSDRPGGPGGHDIYVSTLGPDETFGPPVLVTELNSPSGDFRPAIRRDGLEMFLSSNRPGTYGAMDLWVATRPSTRDPWSAPVNLGPLINTPTRPPEVEQANDWGPALSFDGTTLYFNSAFRSGNVSDMFDIWVATRSKLMHDSRR